MLRSARIVSIDAERVRLQILPSKNCAGCTALCKRPLLPLFKSADELTVWRTGCAPTSYALVDQHGFFNAGHRAGDELWVTLPDTDLLHASWRLYLWPLFGMLCGLLFGHVLAGWFNFNADLGALAGLLCSIAWLRVSRTPEAPKLQFHANAETAETPEAHTHAA